MTFSIVVPNASQSPGLFPAQNNTNFQRLKDIINNEHNFTDSSSVAQGIHKQCTMINRDTPVGLPAGNGVLYSQADGSGASQLHWYNGASDVVLTPPISNAPLKVTGSVVLANSGGGSTSGTIYTVPANSQGTIFVNYISPAGNFYRLYMFYRSSTANVGAQLILESPNTGRPDISIRGANLRVTNGTGGAGNKTVGYWINVVSF
jgi:hypothetical protein